MGPQAWGIADFPAGLLGRFVPVRLLEVGGESVVFLARAAGGAADVVVKVDQASRAEFDQLRLLSLGDSARHVPKILDYGDTVMRGVPVGWMAQEYCPYGSLHQVIYGSAPPAGDAELRLIIAELAECLNFWLGDLGLTHTDVKPANILVRSRGPYELLIGDFGGTARNVRYEGSEEGVAATLSYASPETVRGRRGAPAAWWALGIIAYELLLHRTPYEGMRGAEVQEMLRAGRRPVLDEVHDPAWRSLIEGLLTVEPERRWSYDEVAGWAGENRRTRFDGRTYRRIEHLVDDLERDWAKGIGWLAGNGGVIADWLVELGAAPGEVQYLRGLSPGRAPRALARLTSRVIPEVTPRYKGRPIDAPGLLRLAQGGEAEQRLLQQALDGGVLEYAAGHRCTHPGCRGRCSVVDRVHAEVPEIMGRADARLGWLRGRIVESYRGRGPAELPSAREWTMLWAWATELTLWPEAAARARALAGAVPPGVPWWPDWHRSADPVTVAGRADLVVAQLLAGHAWRVSGQ
ncbi:protein kinase [Actinomadura sp. 9N407]|uniref:protein kinase domain-containing protein n=1 Tax=Actinomadura sp. 9N407 TaxID=3375154 RepID=UPI0037909F90